jgi:hypothetical protein
MNNLQRIIAQNTNNIGRGLDRYWIGRSFASCEQIIVNNLAKE